MSTCAVWSRGATGVALLATFALASLHCSGTTGREDVTGPGAASPTAAGDAAGGVTSLASGKLKDRVAVCHYDVVGGTWLEQSLPSGAVAAHVPGHPQDFLKDGARPCAEGPAPACPCFTKTEIDGWDWEASCSSGQPAYSCDNKIAKACVPLSSGPPRLVKSFATYPEGSGYGCSVAGSEGDEVILTITEPQYDACLAVILTSQAHENYCT